MAHCCSILVHTFMFTTQIHINSVNNLLRSMQTKGTSYWVEMLHYLMFHPMNQQKDLPQCLDKFRLGGRKPHIDN
jgi:uncharacterized membrane protein